MRSLYLSFALGTLLVSLLACDGLVSVRCQDGSNCRKTCECEDGQAAVPCGLNYRCEADGVCSSEFGSASCPEICQTYPQENLCFSQQCANEDECIREEPCQIVQEGQIVDEFTCTQQFACNADLNVCEEGFLLSSQEICQLCFDEGIVGQSVMR